MAQPSLPTGSISFAPGESYLVNQCAYFTPPPVGVANAVWNHADLVSGASFTDQYITPPASAPTGSTVAEVAGPGTYIFYKATTSAFEQLGLTSAQATLNCSDPLKVISYPFTMGNEMSDTYSCTGNSSGQAFVRNGTMDITGTSWGTLTLPYGTFTNVLMINFEQHHIDAFLSDPDFPAEYVANFQFFVKPGVKQPLLSNYEVYSIPGSYTTFSRMLDVTSVGVEEAKRNAIGIDLLPNPATGHVEVVYGVAAGSIMSLEVIDISGKVVLTQDRTTMVTGMQREVLDLTGIAKGVYSVLVTDDKGATGVKRLVVQ